MGTLRVSLANIALSTVLVGIRQAVEAKLVSGNIRTVKWLTSPVATVYRTGSDGGATDCTDASFSRPIELAKSRISNVVQ